MQGVRKTWWVVGLLLAVVVALLSPWASPYPDGLERVAEDGGFMERARDAPYEIIPDYLFPGIGDEGLATVIAGIVGTVMMFGLGYGLAWVLGRRSQAIS